MQSLRDSRELYEYLLSASKVLANRNATDLAETVAHASRTSAGMSTEFLGESRIALRKVLREGRGILTSQEKADMSCVLTQLDKALDERSR
jgi:hypothetical protein